MKTRKIIIASLCFAASALLWSCEDSNSIAPELPEELSLSENILVGSNSALSRVRGTGFGGPMGAIYGNFQGRTNGRSTSPLSMMRSLNGRTQSDTTNVGTPACLTETWEDNGDGSYTYTLDFGDGCDYYGEFLKGKLVETGTYTDNSFNSSVTYTDFGGEDWFIDGTYSYSGTYEDSSNGTSEPADSSNWTFAATYSFEADLTQQYTDYGYPEDSTQASTGETIVTVDYEANGTESMDESGYTVEARSEAISVSTGETYAATVDSPLFYNYACEEEDTWVFVSGVESGSYTYEGISGTYSIDYGNGACDNIILLTENGTTEEIDLGDLWDDWEEECGDDHNAD